MGRSLVVLFLASVLGSCTSSAGHPGPEAWSGRSATSTPDCPDPADPTVSYYSRDPAECATAELEQCAEGETFFLDECGCGCLGARRGCPDPADPTVSYYSEDPAECATAELEQCAEGETFFFDECGCGCLDVP